MTRLSEDDLHAALLRLPNWSLNNGKIVRTWTFSDFPTAVAFVNRVAEFAEAKGHHPDIDIRYNHVTLGLVTHDANGITLRDTDMCGYLDANL